MKAKEVFYTLSSNRNKWLISAYKKIDHCELEGEEFLNQVQNTICDEICGC